MTKLADMIMRQGQSWAPLGGGQIRQLPPAFKKCPPAAGLHQLSIQSHTHLPSLLKKPVGALGQGKLLTHLC